MKIIIIDGNQIKVSKFIEWLIYMLGYAIILSILCTIFTNTIQIDNSYFGLWSLITSILIFILNRTIKPLIVWLTIPLTAITLGLFYPFINVLILQIVDLLLGTHFNISGIIMAFIVACLISLLNILLDKLIISPILRKE